MLPAPKPEDCLVKFYPQPGSAEWPQVARQIGQRRLTDYVEFLLWSQELLLAREVLKLIPAPLENLAGIEKLRALVEAKVAHLATFETYKAFYDKETERTPDVGHSLAFHCEVERYKRALEWVRSLPAEGPPIEVLVIGGQTGYLEAALLEANHRIVTTSCDIADAMQPSLRLLIDRFSGRARVHQVKTSVIDWPVGPFNAIFAFEVLEHVPDVDVAVHDLSVRLKPDGEVWISTPNMPMIPHYANPEEPPDHVRAFNPGRLARLLKSHGLTGSVETVEDATGLLARVKPRKA